MIQDTIFYQKKESVFWLEHRNQVVCFEQNSI